MRLIRVESRMKKTQKFNETSYVMILNKSVENALLLLTVVLNLHINSEDVHDVLILLFLSFGRCQVDKDCGKGRRNHCEELAENSYFRK